MPTFWQFLGLVVLGMVLPLVAWLIGCWLPAKNEDRLLRQQAKQSRIYRLCHWAFWEPYLVVLAICAWLVWQWSLPAGMAKTFFWTFSICALFGGLAFAGLLSLGYVMNHYERLQQEMGL